MHSSQVLTVNTKCIFGQDKVAMRRSSWRPR